MLTARPSREPAGPAWLGGSRSIMAPEPNTVGQRREPEGIADGIEVRQQGWHVRGRATWLAPHAIRHQPSGLASHQALVVPGLPGVSGLTTTPIVACRDRAAAGDLAATAPHNRER